MTNRSAAAAAAATTIQARWRGVFDRHLVAGFQCHRRDAAKLLSACWSAKCSRRRRSIAAIAVQRVARGRRSRTMALNESDSMWCAVDDFDTLRISDTWCGVLSTEPLVSVVDHFLSAAECSAILASATQWRRSGVSLEVQRSASEGRTSETALDDAALEKALAPLRERLAHLLGVDASRFETSMVLRYAPGGEYRWHYDAYDETTSKGQRYTRRRGQRLMVRCSLSTTHPRTPRAESHDRASAMIVCSHASPVEHRVFCAHAAQTAIAYLNDVPAGGETAFFHLQKAVAPRAGRLLTFRNVTWTCSDEVPGRRPVLDRRTFHAGLPVGAGEKTIVTTFLRER